MKRKSKPVLDSLTDSFEWGTLDRSKWPDLLDATSWMIANGHLRDYLEKARRPQHWGYQYQIAWLLQDAEHLLPDDRWAMFQIFLAGLRAWRRQQIPGEAEVKVGQMAAYSMLLEADGVRPKNAIAETKKLYNVSDATVYAARRRFRKLIQEEGLDRKWRDDPERRRRDRRGYEHTAKFWWSRQSKKPSLGSFCSAL